MLPIREILSTRESDKTPENANRVISFIRQNWYPLISQGEAEIGMAYLLGTQDMSFVRNLFQNTVAMNLTNENKGGLVNGFGQPITATSERDVLLLKEMNGLGFKSLPVMEKLRNVPVAEMKKMGVVVNARAEDPTSTSRRVHDRGLIENKRDIEGLLSYVYTSIGQKPYTLKQHAARFKDKPDNGNTDLFDQMNFDPGDPADVKFFLDNFHKLDEEISVQKIIDYVASYNQWIIDAEKWVTDDLAKKAIAATCYVSDVTGMIMTKYLAPETVWIYGGGNRKDFNDAGAKGYERKVSIKEMLDILGNKIDIEKEWSNILQAITNCSRIEFTGITPSYRGFVGGQDKLTNKTGLNYTWNDFMALRVSLGYIEWVSQNEETFGDIITDNAYYENNQSTAGKYPTKAKWQTPTYKAYYLAISAFDQVMFDFGKVSFQDIEGSTDFNVNFTIVTYKEIGDPIAIIAAPFIDIMNEAWYKFRYELRRAKPRGRGWNYDSVISSMMNMIGDTNISEFNKLEKVISLLDSSANEIYNFPVIEGETKMIPGNQLNYDIPNGLSENTLMWWKVIMDVGQYLSSLVGFAPLREGDPGNPRDSMNNQFKALEYSQASTYYIPDMITYMYQQLSVKASFYAQDIILYKNYNSLAYKALEDAVGDDTLDKIEKVGKTALHRFGIFIESLNQSALRQELKASLFEAVKNKTITIGQQLLIEDIKSPKLGFLTFAFFEQRNQKIAEKAQQQQAQQQQQGAISMEQMRQKTEMIKGDYSVMVAKIQAEAQEKNHVINQQGGLAKQAMKNQADSEGIVQQAMANMAELEHESNITSSQPTPNIPQPAPPPMQQQGDMGAAPSMPPPQSVAQQLRQNAMPQNTGSNL